MDDALEVHVDDQASVVLKHDVNCNFVEHILLVRRVCSVAHVKQLEFVRPMKLIVKDVRSSSE